MVVVATLAGMFAAALVAYDPTRVQAPTGPTLPTITTTAPPTTTTTTRCEEDDRVSNCFLCGEKDSACKGRL